jgi:hypothetical protein
MLDSQPLALRRLLDDDAVVHPSEEGLHLGHHVAGSGSELLLTELRELLLGALDVERHETGVGERRDV